MIFDDRRPTRSLTTSPTPPRELATLRLRRLESAHCPRNRPNTPCGSARHSAYAQRARYRCCVNAYPPAASAGTASGRFRGDVTFGVEEEFFLVDPRSRLVVPRAADVIAEIPPSLRGSVKYELLATQVEIATPICRTLLDLRESLIRLRRAVVEAADRVGCCLLPAGTGLLDSPSPAIVAENDRFVQQAIDLGALVDLPGLSACHVHIGVPDKDMATLISNHLRPWLPILHALNTNSPFAAGRDTGYASWRSMLAVRYPTSGPPPWFDSAAHYDRIVTQLIESGGMNDQRMLYWYARPSSVHPTIEVRVGDVCPTVDDTVLLAGLTRALVLTVSNWIEEGRPAPRIDEKALVAAHWRASRFGIDGDGADFFNGGRRPAWQLLDHLIDTVSPVLSTLDDTSTIQTLRAAVWSRGSGASRQRAMLAETGHLGSVVDFLIGQMLATLVNAQEGIPV
jgi:glutamate---cysteine ligase / carboxylate-amine ligase